MKNLNILFVCKYNRFRSRVAEAYFKKINKNKDINIKSAGVIKGNPVNELSAKIARKFKINIKGKTKGLTPKILEWQNMIVIVADDVPASIFSNNKKYSKKVIVWKIADVRESEINTKGKIQVIKKIIKRIEGLNKDIESGRIKWTR